MKSKIVNLFTLSLILMTTQVFALDWSDVTKIVPSDRAEDDRFGYSIAISGDYAIVGACTEEQDDAGENTLSNAGSAYIFHRDGSTWTQQQKIVASDRATSDAFGSAVAISGDYAIVTAPAEDENEAGENTLNRSGSAYIFHRNGSTWTQQQKIVASDRAIQDNFGASAAISGDYAIVGTSSESEDGAGENTLDGAGSVYIFHRNGSTWTQQQKIVASDRTESARFGRSAAISGDYAIVGATDDKDEAGENTLSNAGSAYIFHRDGTIWTQQQKIVAPDRAVQDLFGLSVTISGNYAIVAAYFEDEDEAGENTLTTAGSIYIFKGTTDVPSPISLTLFTAKAVNGAVELAWETATETNNANFVIYRNNKTIACVTGAGTTSEPHNYTYTDHAVIPSVSYTYILADMDYANEENKYTENAVTVTVTNNLIEADFVVGTAYPNPFNPITIVPIELSRCALVKASLYDLSGRKVKALINASFTTGIHELSIDGSNLTTGVYLVQIMVEDVVSVQKIALMK